MVARVRDEVGDDQEVAGEAHLADGVELHLQPFGVGLVRRRERRVGREREVLAQAEPALLAQHRLAGRPLRHLELGHLVHAHLQLEVAALGDLDRVRQRLRQVGEDLGHLGGRLHVEALPVEAEARRVAQGRARADAEQRLVRAVVVGVQVVGVVGRDERQPEVGRDLEQLLLDPLLELDPVPLQLDVEATGEDAREVLGELPGALGLARPERAADHRRQAARGRDQALAVLAQELEVDPGLVVEALEVALRDQRHEVPIAGLVHRDQEQMVDRVEARLVLRALLLLEARARRDVGLAADQRLHAGGAGLLVELGRAEEVAVVGHADRALAERPHLLEERRELDRAVEQRVLGVEVQMNEAVPRRHLRSPRRRILARRTESQRRDLLRGVGRQTVGTA